ncbi:MAG: glycosyltransferase family 2 protein [Candidatus Dormibacteraeota bacterium]|uniref:dolichyl-phosphate beta-glucosyltransferase n=1 Tax=Candidatus Amunia macphersoniae TaxID=3127014 RepID=A0A934NAD1_9BACT|nr:glycosyltransferase family 2 protein [Candidatus Dormibacteraeota bacterium]
MISLVIPAYDERQRLPDTLARAREYFDHAGEEYEVIVADDGSTDGTVEFVESVLGHWPQLTLVALGRNQGKGAAVRAGMLAARGEHRAFSDADLSTPIEELPRLRQRLGGRCEVAIASRAVAGATIGVHQPGLREMMGRNYNRLVQVMVLPGLHDTQCGFKVFTAKAAVACFEPMRTRGFGFDAEALVLARRQGWEIAEVPVRWDHREASRVSAMRDSGLVLLDLVKLRLRRRRPPGAGCAPGTRTG